MCVVSMIGDDWQKMQLPKHPWVSPTYPTTPGYPHFPNGISVHPSPSREEFAALKREVEARKKLLLAAKAYDEATGQPDCEVDEKVDLIKRIAELVGVDISDVFPNSK